MARDAELLAAAESGRFSARVYSWTGPWVTLGRAQDPEVALVNREAALWVTRPTGGAAVLHGHDLTLAIAIPMRRSVRQSYRLAAAPLIDAFAALGHPVGLGEDRSIVRASSARAPHVPQDCFQTAASNDLVRVADGRKVCGCALRRTSEAVLLQASIPIGPPLVRPSDVIRGAAQSPWLDIAMSDFAEALASSIRARFFRGDEYAGVKDLTDGEMRQS